MYEIHIIEIHSPPPPIANPLLAAVYENVAVVPDDYFNNVSQEIQSLHQSLFALESATLLYHSLQFMLHNVRPLYLALSMYISN